MMFIKQIFSVLSLNFCILLSVNASERKVAASALGSLEDLTWKYRVILIEDGGVLDDFGNKLLGKSTEINVRDIIWFVMKGKKVVSNYHGHVEESVIYEAEKKYFSQFEEKSSKDKNKIVLIGKDGGVKSTSHELDLNEIFQLIDGMPMRKSEIKQNEIEQRSSQ